MHYSKNRHTTGSRRPYICNMDVRISKTLDFIEKNIGQSLSLRKLAQTACLSQSQFHRVFKKETQRTPNQFIEELKVNKAYRLLLESDISVNQLSLELGYNDYETFSRAFKRHFKLSPHDFQSVIDKLKEDICDQEDQIIFAPIDVDNEVDLEAKVKQIAKKLNIPKELLLFSKTYIIEKKSTTPDKKTVLVKNKFALSENKKIWESLIN